jgi:putative GTP pyrophosphokinase
MLSLGDWYERHAAILSRATDELARTVDLFLSDWAPQYGFRPEREVAARAKTLARLEYKCLAKHVNTDALLKTPFPITDLIGARIVLRSLKDVDACRRAIVENFPLQPLHLDDKISRPTGTGYRALHFDGVIRQQIRSTFTTIPFELQVKTFAQDSWGYYTHDEAYSRTDVNRDARFHMVRELQRILADQLFAVDELQSLIEGITDDVLHQIGAGHPSPELTFVNVQNLVKSLYEEQLSVREAQEIVDLAKGRGIEELEVLKTPITVELSSSEAERVLEAFKRTHDGRAPVLGEFLTGLLEDRLGARHSQ